MEFSRKKYIILKQEFPQNSVPLHSAYMGYIYKRVSDWGIVKFNNTNISEVIEYESFYCYVPDLNFDEFSHFYSGKRPLLIEKYSKRSNQKEILVERQPTEAVYVPLKVKLEKIIMSNGNSYITIV